MVNWQPGKELDPATLARLVEQAGFRGNPGIMAAAEAVLRSRNPAWRERLLKFLAPRLAANSEAHPFAPSPGTEELPEQGIRLGNVLLADGSIGADVMLPLEQFLTGVFVSGITGSGKSTLLFYLCDQLSQLAGVRVWIFDREGEAPSRLAHAFRERRFRYIRYRHLARNLLEPVGGELPPEMINRLLTYWHSDLTLGDGSENLLAEAMHSILEEHGVLSGGDSYPTLWHLLHRLDRIKAKLDARQRAYWETAYNRISVLMTLMADVYDNIRGYSLEQLLNENLAIDLTGISDMHLRFFVSDLTSCAMAIKEHLPSPTINVLCVDEFHRFGRSGAVAQNWEPFMWGVPRIGRRRRLGLLAADQVPSQVPSAVMGNMSTRIAMRTVNGPCKEALARSMSLEKEEMAWLSQIPSRAAVLHSVIYPRAFAISIPEVELQEPLTEEELRALHYEFLQELSFVPRLEGELDSKVRETRNSPFNVPKELLDLMIEIDKSPFLTATARDEMLGLSAYRGNKLRSELEKRGLAALHRVSLGRRGKNVLLVELTPKAYEVFDQMKVKAARHRGKGSFIHRFWQQKVREHFEAARPGCICVIEDAETGKAVDVSVDTGEKRTAVEICISNTGNGIEKEVCNLAKDDGYEEIVVVAQDEETLARIKTKANEELGEEKLKHVRFELLARFAE